MNALMQDVLTGEILDYFGGREDMRRGPIRHVNDAAFVEDPLRAFRAAQLAARCALNMTERRRAARLCLETDAGVDNWMALYDGAVRPRELSLLARAAAAEGAKALPEAELKMERMLALYCDRMNQPHVMGRDSVEVGMQPGPRMGGALKNAHAPRLAGVPKQEQAAKDAGMDSSKQLREGEVNMIDIKLLGTAALMPIPERALTAATLTCAGHTILFDCGEGTQTAARRAGVSLMKADLIALTHYHGDHIFGLPGLMQTMCMADRTEPLAIAGPAGLREAMEPILKLTGWTSYEIRLIEIPPEGLRLCELAAGWPDAAKLSCFPTEHRVPSQGYCFTLDRAGKFMPEKARALGVPTNQWGLLQKGQSVQVGEATVTPEQVLGAPRKGLKFVFTGDTAPCESLVRSASEADLMICEATYGENDQAQLAIDHGHMNFAQAAEVAARAGVQKLWLAHYSQMIEDPRAYLPNATVIFGETVCGENGLSTTLQFQEQGKGKSDR